LLLKKDSVCTMLIFSTGARTDPKPRHRTESRFEFLDRVEQVYWSRVRKLLEDWASHYPDGHDRHNLLQRLRSSDDNAHDAAFWELYVHESLLCDGWRVTPHPELSGTSRLPDYLAQRGADTMVVEATTIGRDTSQIGEDRRLQQVLAGLDGIQAQDLYLAVDCESIGSSSLATKPLRRELEQWLSGLDVTKIRAAVGAQGWTALPERLVEPGLGWRLTFRAVPVREGVARRPGSRAVGMEGPGQAVFVDQVGPLQRRLEEKAGRYGSIGQPYVIAVLDLSEYGPHEDDYANALYGTLTGRLDVTTGKEHSPFRASDGFWSRGRARATSVSAVVTAWGICPWTVPTFPPVLWQNPTPPVTLPRLPWESRSLMTDGVSVASSPADQDLRAFFSLSSEWPGPEAPFV
jgi:hypothetical protein